MPTSKTPLLDLPMEVLVMIAELCLEDGVIPGMTSLVALRGTCRPLRAITTPVLLGRVFIATNKGLKHFMQHLEDCPGHSKQVYDLTIGRKICSDSLEYGDALGYSRWNLSEFRPSLSLSVVLDAAHNFQNLRSLQIRGGTWRQMLEDQVSLKTIEPSTCFPALETFVFSGIEYHMAMEELMVFWTAPRLKVCIVRVHSLAFSRGSQAARAEDHSKNLEPVEYLHLLIDVGFNLDAAQALVRARNARKLAFGLRTEESQAVSRNMVINSFAPQLECLDLTFCPDAFAGSTFDNLRSHLERCANLKSLTVHPYMVEHICTAKIDLPAGLEELHIFGFETEMDEGPFFPSLISILQRPEPQVSQLRYLEIKYIPQLEEISTSVESDASTSTEEPLRETTFPCALDRQGIWKLSNEMGFEFKVLNHAWIPHSQNAILKDQEMVEWDIQRGRKSVEMQDCRLMDIA